MSGMSPTVPNKHSLSSRRRREMMEKVENMVASIENQQAGAHVNLDHDENHDVDVSDVSASDNEAFSNHGTERVHVHDGYVSEGDEEEDICYDRIRDVDTSIHVSDVSTSDEEDGVEKVKGRKPGLDISQVYSSGSEESLESLFGSPDELPEILRTHPRRELQRAGEEVTMETKARRSLTHDLDMEKTFSGSTTLPVVDIPADKKSLNPLGPYPQDRSIASKFSTSACSKSSKLSSLSAATPLQPYHGGQPIVSPPFALLSPDRMRSTPTPRARTTARTHFGATMNHEKKRAPSTDSKIPAPPRNQTQHSYSYTTRKSSSTTSTTSTRILSPPRMNHQTNNTSKFRRETQSASKVLPSQRKSMSTLAPIPSTSSIHAMKKEIDDLTAQFADLERESDLKRRERKQSQSFQFMDPNLDIDDRDHEHNDHQNGRFDVDDYNFDDSRKKFGHHKERKTRWNYTQNDNTNENDPPRRLDGINTSRTSERQHLKHAHSTPENLLRGLDSSDGYVQRHYPPVPKTPGTMFTTEFVELMGLDVGEHAYLAEVMDRQWRTTTDYRP